MSGTFAGRVAVQVAVWFAFDSMQGGMSTPMAIVAPVSVIVTVPGAADTVTMLVSPSAPS